MNIKFNHRNLLIIIILNNNFANLEKKISVVPKGELKVEDISL